MDKLPCSALHCTFIIVVRRALTLDPPDGLPYLTVVDPNREGGAGSVFQGGGSQITGGQGRM